MYLYVLHNKSKALEAFKVFNAEVEKKCKKNKLRLLELTQVVSIMVVIEDGQAEGPFAKFLQQNGIVA